MANGRHVSYLRVSTARQGRSGLGLEAQRNAVEDYLNGGRWTLAGEFLEVESGRRNERPELAKALAACRLHSATLVIAKLDRLSRNAAFLLNLRDANVEFVAADMPGANRMTIGVMALVAEQEADAISARTTAALAAAKRRGVKLGGHPERLSRSARRKGAAESANVRSANADQRAADLAPILADIRKGGAASLREIAAALNERGLEQPRGGAWGAASVSRLLARLAG
jgi:DNA invertase Pin-like site-specific DNA recombinase